MQPVVAVAAVFAAAIAQTDEEKALLAKLPLADQTYVLQRLKGELPDLTPDGRLVNLRVGIVGQFPGTLYEVSQVIDGKNVLVRGSADIWVEGVDTSSLADGQDVHLKGVYWARATRPTELLSAVPAR